MEPPKQSDQSVQARGVLIGHDENGSVVVPAPVDYISWTERIAGFATDPELLGLQNRVLWITGKMTPLAHQQLIANWLDPARGLAL
jgi:hypothetical protein